MLDTSLDPLGDGSLLESYTFEASSSNLQGTNSYTLNTATSYVQNGRFGQGIQVGYDGSAPSANLGNGITGDVGTSYCFWVYVASQPTSASGGSFFYKIINNTFGGDGINDRYGTTFQYTVDNFSGSLAYQIQIRQHKDAYNLTLNESFPIGQWVMVSLVYDPSVQKTYLYFNDTLKGETLGQMKFLDNPSTIDGVGSYPAIHDQYMTFTKALSQAEITNLYTNMTQRVDVTVSSSLITLIESTFDPLVHVGSIDVIVADVPIETQTVNQPIVEIINPPNTDDYIARYRLDIDPSDDTGNYNGTDTFSAIDDSVSAYDGVARIFPADVPTNDASFVSISGLTIAEDYTISLWVTSDNLDNGSVKFLLGGDSPETDNSMMYIYGSTIYVARKYGGSSYAFGQHGLGVTWSNYAHIVLKQNGAGNTLKLFINNNEIPLSYSGTIENVGNISYLGVQGGQKGTNTCWRGKLSELRVYQRAMSDYEIGLLYNLGVQGEVVPTVTVSPDVIPMSITAFNPVSDIIIPLTTIEASITSGGVYFPVTYTIEILFDVTFNIDDFILTTFDITYDMWAGYENVSLVVEFDIVRTVEAHTGLRTFNSVFDMRYKVEADYIVSGGMNIEPVPLDFDAYFPLDGKPNDYTGIYGGTENGVVEYVEHQDLGLVASFTEGGSVTHTAVTLTDDLTISLWFNKYESATPVLRGGGVDICFSDRYVYDSSNLLYASYIDFFKNGSSYVRIYMKDLLPSAFSNMIQVCIRRKNNEVSTFINGVQFDCIVSGTLSSSYTIDTIYGYYSMVSDVYYFNRALSDKEIEGLADYNRPTLKTFDTKMLVLDSSVKLVDTIYNFDIKRFVQHTDSDLIIAEFDNTYEVIPSIAFYDRKLLHNFKLVQSCTVWYPLVDSVLSYDSNNALVPKVDIATTYESVLYKLPELNKKLFNSGLDNTKSQIQELMIQNESYDSAISFWMTVKENCSISGIFSEGYYDDFQLYYKQLSYLYVEYSGDTFTIKLNSTIFSFTNKIIVKQQQVSQWVNTPHNIIINKKDDYWYVYIDGVFHNVVNCLSLYQSPYVDGNNNVHEGIGYIGYVYHDSYQPLGQKEVNIGSIRKYDKALNDVEIAVVANDPMLICAYKIHEFTFTIFDIKRHVSEVNRQLKQALVHDIFDDGSCVNHWDFQGNGNDNAVDGKRHIGSNYGTTGKVSGYNTKDKLGISSGVGIFYAFNDSVSSDDYSISWSAYIDADNVNAYECGFSISNADGWIIEPNVSATSSGIDNIDFYIKVNGRSFRGYKPERGIRGWHDFVLTSSRMGMSKSYKNTLYVDGVNFGTIYSPSSFYPIENNIVMSQPYFRRYCLGMGQHYKTLGAMRIFNRVLSEEECIYLNRDAMHFIEEYDIKRTVVDMTVNIYENYIVYGVDPSHILFNTIKNVDPFGDLSGEYLWRFDGTYLEDSGRGYVDSWTGSYENDGVFDKSGFGGVDLRFENSIINTISLSMHIRATQWDGVTHSILMKKDTYASSETSGGIIKEWYSGLMWRFYPFANFDINLQPTLIPLTDGEWSHIVLQMEYDGASLILECFCDGVFIEQYKSDWNSKKFFDFIRIGDSMSYDQVRVFNRMLTVKEIQQLKTEERPPVAFVFKYNIEPFTVQSYDIIQREVKQFTILTFDVSYTISDRFVFNRFKFVYLIEKTYPTIFVRRVN